MDVLYTVYLFNISELLPEILISISSCFTKAIRNNKEQFAKEGKEGIASVEGGISLETGCDGDGTGIYLRL